jgi:hypothetical protein
MVIAYSYLWAVEARRGGEEGRKDRPCVIVLSIEQRGGETNVVVAPVTHTRPDSPKGRVALPLSTKQRLGLDDEPSWIGTDDLNSFVWPGHDLRYIRGSDRYDYGVLPASILAEVKKQVLELAEAGEMALTTRD